MVLRTDLHVLKVHLASLKHAIFFFFKALHLAVNLVTW